MKKLCFLLITSMIASMAGAQWNSNGTSIYYPNGNVGVGISTPAGPLHVFGGNTYLWGLNLGYGTNPAVITTDDNSKGISLQIAGSEYARLHNNGNFGIGNTNPQFKLDVNGTTRGDLTNVPAFVTRSNLGVVIQQGNIGGDFNIAQNYLSIFAHNAEFNGSNWIRRNPYGNTWATVLNHDYYDVQFAAGNSAQPVNSIVSPTSYLRITSSGNIGLGTNSPSFKLHVEGDQYVNGDIRTGIHSGLGNYSKKIILGESGNADPVWIARYNVAQDQTEFRVNIGDGEDGGDKFVVGTTRWYDGVWVPGFSVSANGQVGIGTMNTSDANYRLFVEKGIRTRKVKVDVSSWADYVFAPGYQLLALSEVEAFIEKNKRLPDVPSAEEVATKGLDLGENQALLLKKIEELTLYIIELNKEIKQLKMEQNKPQ